MSDFILKLLSLCKIVASQANVNIDYYSEGGNLVISKGNKQLIVPANVGTTSAYEQNVVEFLLSKWWGMNQIFRPFTVLIVTEKDFVRVRAIIYGIPVIVVNPDAWKPGKPEKADLIIIDRELMSNKKHKELVLEYMEMGSFLVVGDING